MMRRPLRGLNYVEPPGPRARARGYKTTALCEG